MRFRLCRAPSAAALLLLLAAALGLGACHSRQTPPQTPSLPGRWYVVQSGETLADIARRAGVPEEDLREANGLERGAELQAGRTIFVLEPRAGGEPGPLAGAPGAAPGGAAGEAAREPVGQARLRWPVADPRLSSPFGSRWGRTHEGIDIAAPTGTPIMAADAGEVIYAGNTVRGYGNMVVVRHAPDLLTVYAHNSVLLVRSGDRVGAGQRLALSGQTGRATAPHLHFEVREGERPRDPLLFLPRP